jgi:hypothetical protein
VTVRLVDVRPALWLPHRDAQSNRENVEKRQRKVIWQYDLSHDGAEELAMPVDLEYQPEFWSINLAC